MVRRIGVGLLLSSIGLAAALAEAPDGWQLVGRGAEDYTVGVEYDALRGSDTAFLRSKTPEPRGFGALLKGIDAKKFRGQRIRMTGQIKSVAVDGWAGMWMRIDGKNGMLEFDNMQERPIQGTVDWKKYEIVLDIPQDGDQIVFGVMLYGRGEVWFDDVALDRVGANVPTTGRALEEE